MRCCLESHLQVTFYTGEPAALLLTDTAPVVQVLGVAAKLQAEHGDSVSLPAAVVCVSAKEGMGVQGVSAALEPLLNENREAGMDANYF